jgi:hypothetical protein
LTELPMAQYYFSYAGPLMHFDKTLHASVEAD